MSYGVPLEWVNEVRQTTEDTVLNLADHLPREAAEALLELATGGIPRIPETITGGEDPFTHPDAQRRFRVVPNVEELALALDYPWEKWAVFLHPAQREAVVRLRRTGAGLRHTWHGQDNCGAAPSSPPGALDPYMRVLLTTFSETLANVLRGKLRILVASEPAVAERVEVHALNAVATRLYERNFG